MYEIIVYEYDVTQRFVHPEEKDSLREFSNFCEAYKEELIVRLVNGVMVECHVGDNK